MEEASGSRSRATAGPVVRGLEAPGAHPGGGAWSLRTVRNAGAVRTRRGGRGLQCHGPAGGLRRRQRLSPGPLSERHLDAIAVLYNPRMSLHRDIQNMSGHANHALALGVDGRPGVARRRTKGTPRPGWKTRRAAGSCEVNGWTCTTSPSASTRAALIRSNPMRAAAYRKPMLGHSGKRAFRCRSDAVFKSCMK